MEDVKQDPSWTPRGEQTTNRYDHAADSYMDDDGGGGGGIQGTSTPGSWLKSALLNTPGSMRLRAGDEEDELERQVERQVESRAAEAKALEIQTKGMATLREESERQHSTIMALKERNADLAEQLTDAEAKFKKLKVQAKSKIKAAEEKAAKVTAKAKDATSSTAAPRSESTAAAADCTELLTSRVDKAEAEQTRLAALLAAEAASKDELLQEKAILAEAAQLRLTESVAKLNELLAEKEDFAADRAEFEVELAAKIAAITERDGAIEELKQSSAREQAAVLQKHQELEQKYENLAEAAAAAAAATAAAAQVESEARASTKHEQKDDKVAAELEDVKAQLLAASTDATISAANQSVQEASLLELSAALSEAKDAANAANAAKASAYADRDATAAAAAATNAALEAAVQDLVGKRDSVVADLSVARENVASIRSERDSVAHELATRGLQVAALQSQLSEATRGLSSSASNIVELEDARSSLQRVNADLTAAQLLAKQHSAERSESTVREDRLQIKYDNRSSADATTIQDLRQKLEAAATMVKQSEVKLDNMTAERGRLVAAVEKAGTRREDALESMRGEFEAQLQAKEDELQVCLEQVREAEETLETVEVQADKERDDAELANEALNEADAKVLLMESQVSKLEAEKSASIKLAEEATTRLVDAEALLAASASTVATLQEQLQGTESENQATLDIAQAEVARLTGEQVQSKKELEMHTNSVTTLQSALRASEQQVARAEEQYIGLTNEVQLLKLQHQESSAALDREQQASESKLQAAESEIEDLTQRIYDKSSRMAGLEAELELQNLKSAKSEEAAAVVTSALSSTGSADEDAEDQAAEAERELNQARDQLAAALQEAALTRKQLAAAVTEAGAAKTEASQAAAALSTATLSFESNMRDQVAVAVVERQAFVQQNATRENALKKHVADLQEEAKATAARLAVLGESDSIVIDVDAASVVTGTATADSTTAKSNRGGALEGAKNLARVFMCYRLDNQMQLYLFSLHVMLLYLVFFR